MPRRGAGRKGSLDEARELVALVSSLSEAGDALTVEAVSSRLGVSEGRAEKLLALVATSSAGAGGLPLVEDGGEVTMLVSGGLSGRRLRLTHAETLALAAALERLGVAPDDPLRARLEGSLSPLGVDEGLVGRVLGTQAEGDPAVAAALAACARALAAGRALAFSYRRLGSERAEERHVVPAATRVEEGTWYLDGHDLDREDERTFRVDRMSDVREEARPAETAAPSRARGARTVRVTFSDARYLDLLPWHDLELGEPDERGIRRGTTPYYGGMWLPRMVAACAGTATTDDAEVNRLAADYARGLLREG